MDDDDAEMRYVVAMVHQIITETETRHARTAAAAQAALCRALDSDGADWPRVSRP
jgi:hypothetical protein